MNSYEQYSERMRHHCDDDPGKMKYAAGMRFAGYVWARRSFSERVVAKQASINPSR
jgi:hypothetical protein